jgi:long-chain acyl-CoA synthetase
MGRDVPAGGVRVTPLVFDEALRAQAASEPDAPALVDASTRMTYAELDEHVGVTAAALGEAGLRPGERAVLVADNSAHHLVTAFAIWRLGGTLVTIYPSSTVDELSYAIANSEPALVVSGSRTVAEVAAAIGTGGTPLVELTDRGLAGPGARDAAPATHDAQPGTTALICYTSGSTSRPKAVVHTHAGLHAAATSYARVWRLGVADTTLVALPLAWAFGLVTTSMATLVAGGRVLILRRGDPDGMLQAFVEHQATFFAGVTTMYVRMVGVLEADPGRARPSDLRLCISGGEPRNDVAFARWRELTGCPVHDVYAASEAFPLVTYDPAEDPEPVPGAAGRVVADAELRVVAADGADATTGEPGEAWARSPAQMTGYWRDPGRTAEVLTPDGWYRTGDLVTVDGDGYVRVVGRLSDLIIRGGANVSPAEVEAVLVAHPDVQEAAVTGVPDPHYGEEVVAAVVLAPSAAHDPEGLRAHCAASLAGYKVPSRITSVERLPRNPNTGKVQRREIAVLFGDDAPALSAPTGGRTP